MSQVNEILQKFDEFETSMKTHLAKVDPKCDSHIHMLTNARNRRSSIS